MFIPEYEIWRVENRWSEDGIDFWDFLSEADAEEFIVHENSLIPSKDIDKVVIRKISQEELIATAVPFYVDMLKDFFKTI